MTEHYTIKELAEAKGTSAPVRAALLALEARVLELEDALTAIAAECWVPVRSDAEMYAAWRKLATERVDIARKVMGISHDH